MKKKNNFIFKYFIFTILLCFSVIYISVNLGYFEYSNQKNASLTKEKILEFESDILDGKEIDLNDYIEEKKIKNEKSGIGLFLSENLSTISRKSVIQIFKMLNKFVDN